MSSGQDFQCNRVFKQFHYNNNDNNIVYRREKNVQYQVEGGMKS